MFCRMLHKKEDVPELMTHPLYGKYCSYQFSRDNLINQ